MEEGGISKSVSGHGLRARSEETHTGERTSCTCLEECRFFTEIWKHAQNQLTADRTKVATSPTSRLRYGRLPPPLEAAVVVVVSDVVRVGVARALGLRRRSEIDGRGRRISL
eukprot:1933519-Pleurochrysis_carterae.AAC.1